MQTTPVVNQVKPKAVAKTKTKEDSVLNKSVKEPKDTAELLNIDKDSLWNDIFEEGEGAKGSFNLIRISTTLEAINEKEFVVLAQNQITQEYVEKNSKELQNIMEKKTGKHLMLSLIHIFPNALVIKLEQNYRSYGNILKAAHSVIQKNNDRKGKKLWTTKEDGDKIKYYRADNEKDEARYVAQEIDLLKGKNRKYRDFAILYRTNAQSRNCLLYTSVGILYMDLMV